MMFILCLIVTATLQYQSSRLHSLISVAVADRLLYYTARLFRRSYGEMSAGARFHRVERRTAEIRLLQPTVRCNAVFPRGKSAILSLSVCMSVRVCLFVCLCVCVCVCVA